MGFTRSVSVPTVLGNRRIHLTLSMAKVGFYDVETKTVGHEIRRCRDKRICWGADVRVGEIFWVAANAPVCSGFILPGELYLVHPDRRDAGREHYTCMQCSVFFDISSFGGPGLARYLPASAEDLQKARGEIEAMLNDLARGDEVPWVAARERR